MGVTYEAWLVTYCWNVPGHLNIVSKSSSLAPVDCMGTDIVSGDLLVEADSIMPRQTSRYIIGLSAWNIQLHARGLSMSGLTAATAYGGKPLDAYSVANIHCRV